VPKLGDLSFLELGMVSSSLLGIFCFTAISYYEKVCALMELGKGGDLSVVLQFDFESFELPRRLFFGTAR
jgi:hypothetical protein